MYIWYIGNVKDNLPLYWTMSIFLSCAGGRKKNKKVCSGELPGYVPCLFSSPFIFNWFNNNFPAFIAIMGDPVFIMSFGKIEYSIKAV